MNIKSFLTRGSRCKTVLLLAGLFACSTLSNNAATVTGDPSGGGFKTWDFISSGSGEQSVCFITFSNDQSFAGYEVLAPKPPSASTLGRNSGGSIGRGGGGLTNGASTNVAVFGFGPITGTWSTNLYGKIIGSFTRDLGDSIQGVSFVGKVTTGTKGDRFNFVATTTDGASTYRGIPVVDKASLKTAPGIAGQWTGYKIVSGIPSLENLTLTDSGFPGLYDFSGTGAGYSLMGECIISSQGRIGFAALETPDLSTNSLLRATVGTYKDSTLNVQAKTTGIEDPATFFRFNAWHNK